MEIKGPLLASRGFATLSLAFVGYDDLPKSMVDLECSYFEEASDWLSSQPQVSQEGIGVMSFSSGSQFLFLLAIHRQDLVKAIVGVAPFHCYTFGPSHYKGETFPNFEIDPSFVQMDEKSHAFFKDGFVLSSPSNQDDSSAIVPVEKVNCPMLLVCGKDDLNQPAEYFVSRIVKRLEEHGKGDQCTVLAYPGAGHLIEPPYLPHCECTPLRHPENLVFTSGGEPRSHAIAQEDSWTKIINFFSDHLGKGSVLSHL